MSSQEHRIKIEQLLRQLEQVVEEDSSEALTSHRSTQPDDQAAEVRGDHAQGHAAQGNDDDAATEEPLSKLARACMESAERASGGRERGGDGVVDDNDENDEDSDDEEDGDDSMGMDDAGGERDFVVHQMAPGHRDGGHEGAAGSGGAAESRSTDADQRSQVAAISFVWSMAHRVSLPSTKPACSASHIHGYPAPCAQKAVAHALLPRMRCMRDKS